MFQGTDYLYNKQVFVAWLVGSRLLFGDFDIYGIIFLNMCVVISITVIMGFWAVWVNDITAVMVMMT